ncbi:MAG TPA: hypothetical protein VKV22_00310 [Rhodanobacteraceae bacterium]|nr:hypothetical protein [Rhodanobacteraceae bacterium]
MTERSDAYWDNLGIAWAAINPDPRVLTTRIKRRLRRQTLSVAAAILGGIPLGIAGVVLGIWTIWAGLSTETWNFATRGAAIVLISLLVISVIWSLKNVLKDNTESLSAMMELTLLRAEKWQFATRLGYVACVVAAVLGMIGYGIRVHSGKPPVMSPIEPLVLLAALAVGLFLFHRVLHDHIAKFRYLKRLLLEEEASGE